MQLQAQLMQLEEKAAVAGASQLSAEQELSKVFVPYHKHIIWLIATINSKWRSADVQTQSWRKLSMKSQLSKRICNMPKKRLKNTSKKYAKIYSDASYLLVTQMEDISEKMFTESQQRDWVAKEKDNIEEQQQQKTLLQSQLEETKELLQKERLNVWVLQYTATLLQFMYKWCTNDNNVFLMGSGNSVAWLVA